MKRVSTFFSLLILLTASSLSHAVVIMQFSGSAFFLDPGGGPVPNPDCATCDHLAGEMDNGIITDFFPGNPQPDIYSSVSFLGFDWSLTNVNLVLNPDMTGTLTGIWEWGGNLSTFSEDFVLIPEMSGDMTLVALDGNGDGIKGTPFLDGPTVGFNMYLEGTITTTPVPVPAAVWLFGSGLVGLLAIAKRAQA